MSQSRSSSRTRRSPESVTNEESSLTAGASYFNIILFFVRAHLRAQGVSVPDTTPAEGLSIRRNELFDRLETEAKAVAQSK
jgi:hypothetical protein